MHLSIVTHGRLIGDYHAQHPFVAYTLHDRAGTLASIYIYIYIIYSYVCHIHMPWHVFYIMRAWIKIIIILYYIGDTR